MSSHDSSKIRCLVIQLGRLGDTLQSLMALRAAKQLYPQLEIHFVARDCFADAAKRVPWIAQVTTLPTQTLIDAFATGKTTQGQALSALANWVAPLLKDPWDFSINWTYSEASSYLNSLIPARVKLGYSRTQDANARLRASQESALSCSDGWSHYLQAIVQGGVHQNIHLIDILTTQLLTALQIHVGDPADAGNQAVTSKGFFTLEISDKEQSWRWRDSTRKWIGIQISASQANRTWDATKWAKFASYLLRRHPECGIVVLGGTEDVPAARQFMSKIEGATLTSRPVISLVGETDFDVWATVVGQCQWLLAGDTSAVHLASVLGTRVLNISVGPDRRMETGPYGNGHYVVSSCLPCSGCENLEADPLKHSCRNDVSPEAAYAVWAYASSEWSHRRQGTLDAHFSNLGWSAELGSIQVFRSRIRATDDGGGVHYEPMIQRSMRVDEWTSQVMGYMARAWYCGWVPPLGQEIPRNTVGPTLLQSLRMLDESSLVLEKICVEAARTASIIESKSSRLRSDRIMQISDRAELQQLGQKIIELDKLIERLGPTHPALRGFAQMSKVLMHNIKGELLAELGRESAESYRQINQGVSILREWIRHTQDLAKPVALTVAVDNTRGSQAHPGRPLV